MQAQVDWGDEGTILAHVGVPKVLPLDDHLLLSGRTCAVPGWVLAAARRDLARQVPADENGVRYAAMLAARGNTPGSAARAAIAAARAELEALQQRHTAELAGGSEKTAR